MSNIKKFINFSESLEIENDIDLNYDTISSNVNKILEDSLNSSDNSVKKDFIKSYLKDKESNSIQGFINDSDIFDFYILNKDDIDLILNEVNFFDDSPNSNSIYSLYDYIIFSTKRAFDEVLKYILEEF